MTHESTRVGAAMGPPTVSPTYPGPDRRFGFGKNWASFLNVVNENRIVEAERSLREMIGTERLAGSTVLDVGCGSGLFSLAAMRLGARRVHSFDVDPNSVACARELRRRYFAAADEWTVEGASVLDERYFESLGMWDVVYSWGVLHHTGSMWKAIEHVTRGVAPSGVLFISVYNDQGGMSRVWTAVKRQYNRSWLGKASVVAVFVPYFAGRGLVTDIMRRRNPLNRYRDYHQSRGMSVVHDWIDWLGGYPFEVAKPEEIFDFCSQRGFTLQKLVTRGGTLGCNEFVFRRQRERP